MTDPLAQLFDQRVASHAVHYSDSLDPLFDQEARSVERAVEKRKHEFRAGRHCARRALRALGLPDAPILRQSDRAPRWPEGYVGSITHTGDLSRGYAAAVVAPETVALGLGVDAESDTDLDHELMERVLTNAELEFLARQPEERRGRLGKLFFSAKEAFYKCQYPLTGRFLGFTEVELEVDLQAGSFQVTVLSEADDALREAARAEGRFVVSEGLVVTGVQLLRPGSS